MLFWIPSFDGMTKKEFFKALHASGKKSKSLFYVGEVTIVLAQAGIQTSSPRKRGTSSFIPGFRIALRLSGMTVLMIFVIVQSSQADSTRLH